MFYLLVGPSVFSESDLKKMYPKLSSQRKEKVDGLRFFADKIASASAYLLLRLILKEGFGYENAPCFMFEPDGKPYLADNKKIFFSISHDRAGVAACASKSAIGVDAQALFRYEDMLAERILSDKEKDCFGTDRPDDGFFTRMWTMKESLGKKNGDGVIPYLTSTDFSAAEKEGVYSIGSDVFTVGQRNDLFFSVCGREEEKVVVFTPERFLNAVDALSDAQI